MAVSPYDFSSRTGASVAAEYGYWAFDCHGLELAYAKPSFAFQFFRFAKQTGKLLFRKTDGPIELGTCARPVLPRDKDLVENVLADVFQIALLGLVRAELLAQGDVFHGSLL